MFNNSSKAFYMKYFFLGLLFTISVFASSAQTNSDSSKHLSFKGVPIDGTLDDFVSKMKKGGFTAKGTANGSALLEGDFASYKNCIIAVSTMKQKDLVSKIGVVFPDRDDWSSLSGNYFTLKELLTEKYGKPSEVAEKFESSYQPDSDKDKMHNAKMGRCKYYSTYETGKGTIQLSIEDESVMRCFVKLLYFDKINGEVVRKQALDDL